MRLRMQGHCDQGLLNKCGIPAAKEKPDPGFSPPLRVVVKALEGCCRLQAIDFLKSHALEVLMRLNTAARIRAVPPALDERRFDIADRMPTADAKPQDGILSVWDLFVEQ